MKTFFSWRRLGLIALSGLLGALSFPLAFPIGPREELFASGVLEPLAFVCLVPALMALDGLRARGAKLVGFLAGMVFFTGAFWWVNVAMTTFGGMPNFLSIPALELLVAWCAFHWGLAFFTVKLLEDVHGWRMGWTIAPVWMATELLRNYLFSGFPWANLGYSQTRNLWFSQVASLVGVYGIAFVVALVNGALFEAWRAWRQKRPMPRALVAAAAGALVVGHVYGAIRVTRWKDQLEQAPRVPIAVVQGNIDQKLKNAQGRRSHEVLARYNPVVLAADSAGAQLIVWPEAAFPRGFPTGTRAIDGAGLSQSSYRAHQLIGVDIYDPKDWKHGNENSSFLVTPDLRVAAKHTKYHLVPFGEYVLFDLDKYLPIDNLVPGTFIPGKSLEPVSLTITDSSGAQRPLRVGVQICFDAIFPEITRTQARAGVDLLVNMTNDAWYGFSSAPFQFLRMVQMRAVESGRPVARAANTGISAFIDPIGRIRHATPLGLVDSENGRLSADQLAPPEWRLEQVALVSGRTVYSYLGDWPAYLASAFAVIAGAWALVRRRRAGK